MWPFDSEEQDTSLEDSFDTSSRAIIDVSPDLDTGLAAMRNLYTDSEFKDRDRANSILESRSNELRQKFDTRTPFNFEEAINVAPILPNDVTGEGEDEDSQTLDKINKWETENVKAISESTDPIYIQNRSHYISEVKKAATLQRREVYGPENYLSDPLYRFGEGLVSGPADLLGADSVTDWFKERTNPQLDDSLLGSIASGAGMATGAVVSGIGTGGLGTYAYLGATGLGAIRRQYEEAKDTGATEGQAVGAAALETGSQAVQLVVGGKIFSGAAKSVFGETLGAKVFPKIATSAFEGATVTAAGHVISTEATNIGQGTDLNPLEGVGQAALVGGIVAGGATGAGEVAGQVRQWGVNKLTRDALVEKATEPEGVTLSPIQKEIAAEEAAKTATEVKPVNAALRQILIRKSNLEYEIANLPEEQANAPLGDSGFTEKSAREAQLAKINDSLENYSDTEISQTREAIRSEGIVAAKEAQVSLQEAVEQIDGAPPPPKETVKSPTRVIPDDGLNPEVVAVREDGSQIVNIDGRLHVTNSEGRVGEAYKEVFSVDPEVAQTLDKLTKGHNSDGTEIGLSTENGKLYINSDELVQNPDGSITQLGEKKGPGRIEIPATKGLENGKVDVHVNPITEKNGARSFGFEVGPAPVKESTAGAAHIDDLGYKTHAYIKKLIDKLGIQEAEDLNLATRSYIQNPDGSIKEVVVPLIKYMPSSGKEGVSAADDYINQHGIIASIAKIAAKDSSNQFDVYLAGRLEGLLREGKTNALNGGDKQSANKFKDLLEEVTHHRANLGNVLGTGLQAFQNVDKANLAGSRIEDIQLDKIKQAETELAKEFGVDKVSVDDLKVEAQTRQAEREAAEKDITDQVDAEIARTQAEHDLIEQDKNDRIQGQIDQYQKDIQTLQGEQEEAKNEVTSRIENSKEAIKKELEATNSELNAAETEAEEVLGTKLEPTNAQINREKNLNKRQSELEKRHEAQKRELEGLQKKDTSKLSEAKQRVHQNQIERLKANIDKTQEQLDALKPQLDELVKEREARTSQTKKPTSAQLDKIKKLREKIDRLTDEFNTLENRTPKKSRSVQDIRSKIAERKVEIRRLSKEKKAAKPSTLRQNQLKEKIAKLNEGRQQNAFATKAQRDRLTRALQSEKTSKDRVSRAEEKINKKLAEFPIEEQEKLRRFYQLQADPSLDPSGKLAVSRSIIDLESKHQPITPDNVDRLWAYWRMNVLSGTDTQIRNFFGNVSAPVSTAAAYLVTSGPKVAGVYLRGLAEGGIYSRGTGVGRGIVEAVEIFKGNRAARLTQQGGIEVKPGNMGFNKNLLTRKGTIVGKMLDIAQFTQQALYVPEIMQRALGATDAFFANASKEGQAYVAAYMFEKQKVPVAERYGKMQEALWRTESQIEKITKQINDHAETLKEAGIKLSENEKKAMFYEAMERNRSEVLNEASNRAADRNTFTNPLNATALGSVASGLNFAAKKWEIEIGGEKIHPFKFVAPFTSVAANIGDFWLQHTPFGAPRYLFEKRANVRNAMKEAIELRAESEKLRSEGKAEEADKLLQRADLLPEMYKLEAREHLGRMIVGTAAMTGLAGLFYHYMDQKDPFIKFNGLAGKGEKKNLLAQGIPELSLQVGGFVLTKELLGPLILPAVFADNIAKAMKKGQDPQTVAFNTVSMGMGALANTSFLKSVGDFFEWIQGGEPGSQTNEDTISASSSNFAKSQFANWVQPLIPSSGFIKNVYKWYDGSPQETYNNFGAKLFNNIPVVSDSSNRRLNRWGEEIKFTLWQRLPGNLLLGTINDDPVSKWLSQTGYSVSDIGPTMRMNKEDRDKFSPYRTQFGRYSDMLNEDETYKVVKLSGPEIKAYLVSKMGDPYFSTYSEKGQQIISREISKIRAKARMQVLNASTPR